MGHLRTEPVIGHVVQICVVIVVGDALQLASKVILVVQPFPVRVVDAVHTAPGIIAELRFQGYWLRKERQGVNACLLDDFTHIAVGVTDHTALVVEGIDTAILVVMVDGGQGIVITHAVKAMGVVVVRGGFGLGSSILQPALAVGGKVAAVVSEGFDKLTLLISKPAAQHVVGVVALPVVGHAAANIRVVADKVVVKANRLLTGGMDYPRPDGRG